MLFGQWFKQWWTRFTAEFGRLYRFRSVRRTGICLGLPCRPQRSSGWCSQLRNGLTIYGCFAKVGGVALDTVCSRKVKLK